MRPKTKPVPIRLDSATTFRIDQAAVKMSSNRAAIIRLAIIQFLPDIEAGRIILKSITPTK